MSGKAQAGVAVASLPALRLPLPGLPPPGLPPPGLPPPAGLPPPGLPPAGLSLVRPQGALPLQGKKLQIEAEKLEESTTTVTQVTAAFSPPFSTIRLRVAYVKLAAFPLPSSKSPRTR